MWTAAARRQHIRAGLRYPSDVAGEPGSPSTLANGWSVVGRFFAWLGRNRRLARDFEAPTASAEAFLYAAFVMLLLRRIARLA